MTRVCSRIILVITLIFTLPLAIPAAIAQDNEEYLSFAINPTGVEAKAVEAYWTEERMRNAQPLELEEVSDEDLNSLFIMPVPSQPEEVSRTVKPFLVPEGGETARWGEVQRAHVGVWPFSTGGKLFFRAHGKDRSCSAQYVGNTHVIMTAARCVMDGNTGKPYTNFIFAQRYYWGRSTVRKVYCGSVKNAWHGPSPNRLPYDYAFLYASESITGARSSGALGIGTEIPYKHFWSIGYPKNYDDTQAMYKVLGTKRTIKDGLVSMTGNPFNGATGGAWIGDLSTKSNVGNYAIGLNSHYRLNPRRMISPYFNRATYNLWQFVRDYKCGRPFPLFPPQ